MTLNEQADRLKSSPDERMEAEEAFDSGGVWITNPFWDETGRDRVDPEKHYGYMRAAEEAAGVFVAAE